MTEVEKIEKIKNLVDEIADSYAEPDAEQVKRMCELTGVDWDAEDLQMMCCDYQESPNTLDELVYFLIHEKWPQEIDQEPTEEQAIKQD